MGAGACRSTRAPGVAHRFSHQPGGRFILRLCAHFVGNNIPCCPTHPCRRWTRHDACRAHRRVTLAGHRAGNGMPPRAPRERKLPQEAVDQPILPTIVIILIPRKKGIVAFNGRPIHIALDIIKARPIASKLRFGGRLKTRLRSAMWSPGRLFTQKPCINRNWLQATFLGYDCGGINFSFRKLLLPKKEC
jgi:hypothetical protein